MKTPSKPKYKVGQVVYVVDAADYVRNHRLSRIPMGTSVTVQAVSSYQAKNQVDVRYNVAFDGVPVCWIDEDRLSSALLDVMAA